MRKRSNDPHKSFWFLVLFLGGYFLLNPSTVNAYEIKLKLTGNLNFPGILSMKAAAGKRFERLCFLGQDALGLIDISFLETLAEKGVPEGNYQVIHAVAEERWPDRSFSPNGALRFSPLTESKVLKTAGKNGLAIHAKDFFPLAAKMTDNPKMIQFFSDQLFEKLMERWGTLRISNWDMGRFQDFYRRNTQSIEQWQVRVESVALGSVKTICEPLKVQRRPGAPPE